jgi:hypothetical protein
LKELQTAKALASCSSSLLDAWRYDPLALKPGKTGRLPASDGAAVPFVVELPFETASNVVTSAVTRRRLIEEVVARSGVHQLPKSFTVTALGLCL